MHRDNKKDVMHEDSSFDSEARELAKQEQGLTFYLVAFAHSQHFTWR